MAPSDVHVQAAGALEGEEMAQGPGGPLRRLPPGCQQWRRREAGLKAPTCQPRPPDMAVFPGHGGAARSGCPKSPMPRVPRGNASGAGNRPPSMVADWHPRTRRTLAGTLPAGLVALEPVKGAEGSTSGMPGPDFASATPSSRAAQKPLPHVPLRFTSSGMRSSTAAAAFCRSTLESSLFPKAIFRLPRARALASWP